MSDFTIYHNPKCSKSRQTLDLLKEHGVEPKIVEYLKDPLNKVELLGLISIMNVDLSSIVRTKEEGFKEKPFALDSAETIATEIEKNPKLLERPIVVRGDRAVIGRPPENIKELL